MSRNNASYKNSGFIKSLKCAVSGFVSAVKSERNLRFDLSAAVTVGAFSYAWGLTKGEWCTLLAVIGLVLVAELINTAVEKTVDIICPDFDDRAGSVKDIAAAAPLTAAVIACITACILFRDFEKIGQTFIKITHTPPLMILSLAVIAVDAVLLFAGRKKSK